jgi:hypothetical protein
MSSGSSSEAQQLALPMVEVEPESVRYTEEDVATQFVETPRPDPPWLVQVTLFDRRWMTKDQLLFELQQARLVHAQTRVWQLGMRDWSAIARITELRAALPQGYGWQARRPARPAPRTRGLPGALLLLSLALSLAALLALLQR